jgi:hypothetical protein
MPAKRAYRRKSAPSPADRKPTGEPEVLVLEHGVPIIGKSANKELQDIRDRLNKLILDMEVGDSFVVRKRYRTSVRKYLSHSVLANQLKGGNMNWLTKLVTESRLKHDDEFLLLALYRVYLQQEIHEREGHCTVESNGVGFNQADAPVLTPIAEQIMVDRKHGEITLDSFLNTNLTDEQWAEVRERMPKYTDQVMGLLEKEGLV